METYEDDDNLNYDDLSSGGIGEVKGYGPCTDGRKGDEVGWETANFFRRPFGASNICKHTRKVNLKNFAQLKKFKELLEMGAIPSSSNDLPQIVILEEKTCTFNLLRNKTQRFADKAKELIKKCEQWQNIDECEKAQKITNVIDEKKDGNTNYDNKTTLEEKEKKRIGVTKVLSMKLPTEKSGEISGQESDLIVFLTPLATTITRQNFAELLKENKKPNFFYSSHAKEELKIYERLVAKVDNKSKFFSSKFRKGIGESGTLSLYLSLLSTHYQKPISREVAATGFLNLGNYFRPVSGLEYKIPAAVQAGVKKLILATEQKADYEKNVPQEIRDKLTVYYVKNVEELERLF
ncbi:12957_t:CDS:2 [Ambispora gerdemannii]|uniref:12957_t:CDS:1 n=1 Tax=Ambispora gerdemannii TaxID=144530 RepID=A0A9N8YVN7_9GLOM|nr:12957_t:CDS:2 [Ambispora gerdemannii]